jgi:hypothetical protein
MYADVGGCKRRPFMRVFCSKRTGRRGMSELSKQIVDRVLNIDSEELRELETRIINYKHEIGERERLLREFGNSLDQKEIRAITSKIDEKKRLLQEAEQEYRTKLERHIRQVLNDAFKKLVSEVKT